MTTGNTPEVWIAEYDPCIYEERSVILGAGFTPAAAKQLCDDDAEENRQPRWTPAPVENVLSAMPDRAEDHYFGAYWVYQVKVSM